MQIRLSELRQRCLDRLIDRAGTKTTSYNEERFSIIDFRFSTTQQVLADGIAGEDDLVLGEEALHAFVCHADLRCFVLENLIGDAGESVLLLEQDRNAHVSRCPHGCTGGVTADTDTDIRTEVTDDLLYLSNGLIQIDEYGDVLPRLGTVEAPDGQSDDLI